jgi:hypothetical protein
MPPFIWQTDPVVVVSAFETRHHNPEAGVLLAWAAWTVDGLRYLDDIDQAFDGTRTSIGLHRPDVVDVSHARWATGTCVTALDLCAAALARTFCGHSGLREVDLADLCPTSRRAATLRGSLPSTALQWADDVCSDPDYAIIKEARNWLVHSRVKRHFAIGGAHPPPRLGLESGSIRLPVRRLIELSVAIAERHVSALFAELPRM